MERIVAARTPNKHRMDTSFKLMMNNQKTQRHVTPENDEGRQKRPPRGHSSFLSSLILPGSSLEEGDLPSPDGLKNAMSPNTYKKKMLVHKMRISNTKSRIFDDPDVTLGYQSVPVLEQTELPRGGVSVETSIGRIQFGIPPETIKDSMIMGMEVPRIYIVPTERFCSEWGPALGINLAEFEFPAYFNFFVRRKKCCLVVDSVTAEQNIRSVFEETLLGPKNFRDPNHIQENNDEDFDPDFPMDARPNFYKEFQHFRVSEKTDQHDELTTDMLLDFYHFDCENKQNSLGPVDGAPGIGVPPTVQSTEPCSEVQCDAFDFPDMNRSMSVDMNVSLMQRKEKTPSFRSGRRASLESVESMFSNSSNMTAESMRSDMCSEQNWLYSQIQWLGQNVTVWHMNATEQEIKDRSVSRVEIFKMPGTEYVIHDVNAENIIIGKARIRGTVRVPDEMSVEGFLRTSMIPSTTSGAIVEEHSASSLGPLSEREICEPRSPLARSRALFYPPSFGVTVLGNSHGFDKNGSTSGYVLWVNGRGIMIDPPPYSSATLEREGIRPEMIFGVMITHCHADHDAGAFQKVLTGSRLTVITTPSIYTSFIRKYSALSGLNPNLLKHSHRFRPAIIGQPLKFQGAVFHFTYTLHTIPCIAFKVEWRGRSMVFTGDHLNLPPLLDELEQKGVLSKGRADSLRQMPLQDCDALLHEAGAPPIHTPLSVLQALPEKIKQRLYVVHTSDLGADSGLRVAPTGTAGTIRLDKDVSEQERISGSHSFSHNRWKKRLNNEEGSERAQEQRPEVMNRLSDISDAWFMLNLISNVPFIAGLPYVNTMEILEVACIEYFSTGEVVVPARKRHDVLCVVWEGTCVENDARRDGGGVLWHPGDWSGPMVLQPSIDKAAKPGDVVNDIIALSAEGVKAIMLPMGELDKILRRGSKLYRKYMETYGPESLTQNGSDSEPQEKSPTARPVLDTLLINSRLGCLMPRQIRALESIAEGPRVFEQGAILWKAGSRCDFSFLIATGTASFQPTPGRTRSISYGQKQDSAEKDVVVVDKIITDLPPESEFARLELLMALRSDRMESDPDYRTRVSRKAEQRSSDRNANKVFSRLYASKKCIEGLVVSRGCFLSDIARTVSGDLIQTNGGPSSPHVHSTTLVVGPSGCVAWVFPRKTLMPFLDNNPGVLLSLLGTSVIL